MLKSYVSVLVASLVIASPALAGRDKGDAGASDKPREPEVLQDLTLTGTITKADKTSKKGTTETVYTLTDDSGTVIHLPHPRQGNAMPTFNLDDYLNVVVTITAKGTETDKNGKKHVSVRQIVSVDKAAAPAAAQPAAATPPPAPAPATTPTPAPAK